MARPLIPRVQRVDLRSSNRASVVRDRSLKLPNRPNNPAGLKTMIWQTYTFNQGTVTDFSQNNGTSYLKGYNWEVWRDAVRSRVVARGGDPATEIVETASTIAFMDEALLDLMSLADYAVMDSHSPPQHHVDTVRAKSNVGTQVGFALFNFESINQAPAWHPVLDALRDQAKGFILSPDPTSGCNNDGNNGYGFPVIDKFESRDRTGSECSGSWPAAKIANPPADATDLATKHSWECDIGVGRYPEDLVSTFREDYIAEYYDSGGGVPGFDFGIWDNLLINPFALTTNDFPSHYTNDYYRGAWREFLSQMRSEFGSDFVWANGPDSLEVYSLSDCAQRFIEHWFRNGNGSLKTLEDLQSSISVSANAGGLTMAVGGIWDSFGNSQIRDWWESDGPGGEYGTWSQLRNYINTLDVRDKVIVNCGRSTGGGYLYWQPEFTDPREAV